MTHFCKNCSSLLLEEPSEGSIKFRCLGCHEIYPGKPEDVLVRRYSRKGQMINVINQVEFAHRFPPNARVMKDCKKCKSKFASIVEVGDDSRAVWVCSSGHTLV